MVRIRINNKVCIGFVKWLFFCNFVNECDVNCKEFFVNCKVNVKKNRLVDNDRLF